MYTIKFLTELLHNKRTRDFSVKNLFNSLIYIYTSVDSGGFEDFEEREMAFKVVEETVLIYLIDRLEGKEFFGSVQCIPYQEIIRIVFVPAPELVLIPFTYKEFEEWVQNSISRIIE